jgi:hypothetical protein
LFGAEHQRISAMINWMVKQLGQLHCILRDAAVAQTSSICKSANAVMSSVQTDLL